MSTGTGNNVSKANSYAGLEKPAGNNVSKANSYAGLEKPAGNNVSKVIVYVALEPGIPLGSQYTLGKGGVLLISTDGGATWTAIKQIRRILYRGSKADFDEVTTLDSGVYREWAPILKTAGTVGFQAVWAENDPGQAIASLAYKQQTLCAFQHLFPPRQGQVVGAMRMFFGYLAGEPQIEATHDKASLFSGSIKVTGGFVDTWE
jgi:hypothetical protein